MTKAYLPGGHARAHWMRMDTASLLKRFFLCEQSLIVSQGGWLASIASLEVKLTLPRLLWEDAMTANALRDRVFELRFPSRVLEMDMDTPLILLFDEAINAPSAAAFILSLAQVFKPALLEAYRSYVVQADEIADGPTLRFLRLAAQEKEKQIAQLTDFSEQMLTSQPQLRAEATAWVAALQERLAATGGLLATRLPALSSPLTDIPGHHPFSLAEIPVRDPRFHLCRFYWPDIVDTHASYGEGIALQLRSAISHFNEVWAVETAGAILQALSRDLGWSFIFDAARWTYDESRHCRMGYERLLLWNFEPHELPLGTYIYDSAYGQDILYRLGMLFFFETKNIGKKNVRIKAFTEYGDQVSRHDMEYDWADETIHAHFGKQWLTKLHKSQPDRCPDLDTVREHCSMLVDATVITVTREELDDIHAVAQAMIEKARRQI